MRFNNFTSPPPAPKSIFFLGGGCFWDIAVYLHQYLVLEQKKNYAKSMELAGVFLDNFADFCQFFAI
jgi:hypothetical protein